ncbi:MAG: asparagine synthetase B, partial [Sandaracinus sp.]|nr:asparagine synthetase B [Sandaracinus sp.]
VLRRRVPDALVNRPKMGFGVPIDTWLRGPLRDWAEELLDPKRVALEGYLNPSVVSDTWRDHLAGRSAGQHRLWAILMFQAWRERWLP